MPATQHRGSFDSISDGSSIKSWNILVSCGKFGTSMAHRVTLNASPDVGFYGTGMAVF